jgi:hypothetical protein
MRKEVGISIYAILVIAAAIFMVYYFNFSPTGFAVFSQYTNESMCVSNGYVWENLTEQNCTTVTNCVNATVTCEPCLEYEDLNGTQGECLNWSSCINETCTDQESCVDVVIGGQCTGDVCDSTHLNLCLDENNCTSVSGYWYDDSCNEFECESNGDCESGQECNNEGICVVVETSEESVASEPEPAPIVEPIPEVIVEAPHVTQISIADIQGQGLNQGDSRQLTLSVQNTGTEPVSSCVLIGDDSGLVSITDGEAKGIASGASASYSFLLNLPENAILGAHTITLSVTCSETAATKELIVTVLQKKLDFNITGVQRTRGDRVRVDYSLTDLVGENQDVQIFFSIKDNSGVQVANISQNKSIDANKTDDFRVNVPINETLEGNLTLSAAFNSQIYSSSVLEPITLGAPIGGFAILGGIGGTGSIILLVVVVLVLVIVFFIARKMRKSGKSLGDIIKK